MKRLFNYTLLAFSISIALIILNINNIYGQNNKMFITDTLYFENGNVKTIRKFNSDMSIMYVELYSPQNNRINTVGKYVNKEKDSIWISYNHKGDILLKTSYINGKKDGPEYTYYANGNVAEIIEWKEDVKHGVWKQYFIDKILKIDGHYKEGELDGKITFYYPNGEKSLEGNYVNGSREGYWTYFKDDGSTAKIEKYSNGFLLEDDR